MTRWLVVAVLEALGLGLLWHGQRSGDDMIFAQGAGLVICVTALFGLHLLTDALARRRERDKPLERREPQLFDPTGPLLLTREVGADCIKETPGFRRPRHGPGRRQRRGRLSLAAKKSLYLASLTLDPAAAAASAAEKGSSRDLKEAVYSSGRFCALPGVMEMTSAPNWPFLS